jgi:uncharacterized membrane protein
MSERRFPWRTLLFVSLAFNVLVVGAVIGAKAAGVRFERDAPGMAGAMERAPGPRAFMRALSPESRALVREDLTDAWFASRPLRMESRQARRALYEAAMEEPYDAQKVRTAFAAMRQTDQATLAAFHDALSESLGKLDATERRRVVRAVAEAQRRGWPRQQEKMRQRGPRQQEQ